MPSLFSRTRIPAVPQSPKTKPNLPCIAQTVLDLCSQGHLKQAVDSLDLLACKGLRLGSQAIVLLLQKCANFKSLKEGRCVHLHLKLTGRKHPNTLLTNHLINMYCNCGDYIEARKLFDKMSSRNLYSWNNMLSGYAKLRMVEAARSLFDKMPVRDVVSWNTMVIAYAQYGHYDEALMFYKELRRSSFGFNDYTFGGILTVCVKLEALELTKMVHCQVLVTGFLLSNVVLTSSAVNAYAKCGEMGEARKLFNEMPIKDILAWTTLVSAYAKLGNMKTATELFNAMPNKNLVSWTALISGYARKGMGQKALELFTNMMIYHVKPDQFTFSSCLCACASISSLKHGKQVHAYLMRTGFRPNTTVASSLIDMYTKCGSLEFGRKFFFSLGDTQDVVLWNTMISALAQHGYGEDAVEMFNKMIRLGIKPVRVSFIVILNACSHSGLVGDGLKFFESMTQNHNIVPDEEHYACLIDMLGRGGHFEEVLNQLEKMPCRIDSYVWNALLGVCSIHGNIELGRKAAEKLMELDPQSPAPYILFSSIYAALGEWDSVEKVRRLMNQRHVRKERAISWLDIEGKPHSFTLSDRSDLPKIDTHTGLNS